MRWGVRERLLFAVMVPASLLALLMGGMLGAERLGRIQDNLQAAVAGTAQRWSEPAARAMGAGNIPRLKAIAETAARPASIATVRIRYPNGRSAAVASVDPGQGAKADLGVLLLSLFAGGSFQPPRIELPLPLHPAVVAGAPAAETPRGQIEVIASAAYAGRRFVAALVLPAVTIAAVVAVAGLLAVTTAADITTPLRRLRGHAEQLEAGDLDARMTVRAGAELGELEHSLNGMADALREGQRRLEGQVRQTTTELRETLQAVEVQNVELDVARKRALDASKVKSEFLANVSHEIRTPINGIVGFADLLHHSPLDSEQRDYVSVIKESSTNLLTIVNDILDFSKIEAGKLVIDNVAFDLRDSVEDVLSLLAPAAYGKSLELTHLIYADVPLKLCGDPIRIRQVLTNLVHNAIKFTPAGHVVVRVMLDEETTREALLRVTVSDTGIGLSDDDQSRLFKAFSQADTSLTRRFGGTGLGLIISRKLLEQMGGEIGLESEPGKGSTFWFTLRCQKQPGVQRNDGTGWHNPVHGRRVLLYDPEPTSRLAAQHLLESWGMAVTEVDDRDTFLSLASAAGRYEVAVIGLDRASLNGPLGKTVLRRLREFSVPVMAMASTVDRNELRMLYQRGASVCLPKAVRRQTVFRELCRLIAPGSAPTQPTRHADVLPVTTAAAPAAPPPAEEALSVLVVDDNAINRKLSTTIATRHGAIVTEAEDGRGAVEAYRHARFDVIFMDIHMPGIGGEAAVREIRRLRPSERNAPRIIALTANAMPGERERLLAAGMDDCLIKPATEAQMVAALFGREPEPEPTQADEGVENPLHAEMREMLLAELPGHRRALRRAYRRGDLAALKRYVHKLHGAVSMCQIPALKDACQELENALARGNRVAVPGGMEQVMSGISALLDAKPPAEAENRIAPSGHSSASEKVRRTPSSSPSS